MLENTVEATLYTTDDITTDISFFSTCLGSPSNNDHGIRFFMLSLSERKIHSLRLIINNAPSKNGYISHLAIERRIPHMSSAISTFVKYGLQFGIQVTFEFPIIGYSIEFNPYKEGFHSKELLSKELKTLKVFNTSAAPTQSGYLFEGVEDVNLDNLKEDMDKFVTNNNDYYLALYENIPGNTKNLPEAEILKIPSISAAITVTFIIACIEHGILAETYHNGEDNNYASVNVCANYSYRMNMPLKRAKNSF